jgi:hypothetical protein
MGRQTRALLATLDVECANADQLNAAAAEAFQKHPDHHIITSFPGVGESTEHTCWPKSAMTAAVLPTPEG